jgi:hypothetical protein
MKMSAILVLGLSVFLSGCGDDTGPKDYLAIAGGGLTFNYRYSQATSVVVAKMLSPLPEGAVVEATFDLPGNQGQERVERPALVGKLSYKMESSPMKGIRRGEPLKVTLLVRDAKGLVIDRDETRYTSDVDQSDLPSLPLVQPDKPNYIPQLENLE